MWPRFSLRLILAAFALLSVALYVCIIRPTTFANRFAAAVQQKDYATARSLFLRDYGFWVFAGGDKGALASIDRVYVEIIAREWADLWACRRRILFRVARHERSEGRHVDWTEDTDFVAHINGVEQIISWSYVW